MEELLLIDFSAEMAGERSEQSGGAHIDPCQSEENEPTLCRKSMTEAFLLNTAGLIDIVCKRHYHVTFEDKNRDMDKHDDTYPKKSSTSNVIATVSAQEQLLRTLAATAGETADQCNLESYYSGCYLCV